MHTYYEVKEMLHRELEDIVKKGELSAGSLDTIDKLLNSIKNSCKIIMYEEYSDEDGYSNADGSDMMGNRNYSNARGRTARRDSMGRYSREGGNSYRRGGRGYSRAGGYSYGEGDERVDMLREMMGEASSEEERRLIQKMIRRMENE